MDTKNLDCLNSLVNGKADAILPEHLLIEIIDHDYMDQLQSWAEKQMGRIEVRKDGSILFTRR